MYLWKVDCLVEDFKSGKVSQKEEFKYMLLFTIMTTLMSDPALFIGYSYNHYDAFSSVIVLFISIYGIYHCYKINSIGDDKDFIARIMCIGFPIMVRMLVVMIPMLIIGGALEDVFLSSELNEDVLESTLIDVILVPLLVAGYYWYLSLKIKAVSSSNPQ